MSLARVCQRSVPTGMDTRDLELSRWDDTGSVCGKPELPLYRSGFWCVSGAPLFPSLCGEGRAESPDCCTVQAYLALLCRKIDYSAASGSCLPCSSELGKQEAFFLLPPCVLEFGLFRSKQLFFFPWIQLAWNSCAFQSHTGMAEAVCRLFLHLKANRG